ncbi:hypothetical protein [uncultured Capnocytophaga sp.]|uniref:hypothetical protein n=1 Tax=uncultured Capnocytophaga sp. TaxID=159273 RepID=UPI0026030911|nr:hypothetical protein [uncultured Capnocytophaga sp.]
MKTGKKIALLLLMVLNFGSLSGQSSKNSRKEYVAVDNHTYKKGDVISFGTPSRGESYGTIFIKDIVTISSYIDNREGAKKEVVNATKKELSKLIKPTIKNFREEIIDGKTVKYAILRYTDKKEIAIAIDEALSKGEVVSQEAGFQTVADKMKTSETNTNQENGTIKSFSPKFEVKLLSVIGNKVEQTVTLEFLISHKLVHQKVCFINDDYPTIISGIKAYDFEGNEYFVKNMSVGKNKDTFFAACNKIPTEVPMKASVTFKQILPSVKGLSFVSIATSFRAYDDGNLEYKNLEVSNISINWQ